MMLNVRMNNHGVVAPVDLATAAQMR